MSTEQENLSAAALEYHEWPTPGKIAVVPTKGLTNQRDLALAYSPGVAAACNAIAGSASSPTAPPCWAWATSARWPASR